MSTDYRLCALGFVFGKRIKVVPSCRLPLQIEEYNFFLKDGSPSIFVLMFCFVFLPFHVFPLVQILFLKCCPFFMGEEEAEETEGYGGCRWEMKIKYGSSLVLTKT